MMDNPNCLSFCSCQQQIKMQAQFSYDLLKLETDEAANMIYVNGRLIHRTREEIGEVCFSVCTPALLKK